MLSGYEWVTDGFVAVLVRWPDLRRLAAVRPATIANVGQISRPRAVRIRDAAVTVGGFDDKWVDFPLCQAASTSSGLSSRSLRCSTPPSSRSWPCSSGAAGSPRPDSRCCAGSCTSPLALPIRATRMPPGCSGG